MLEARTKRPDYEMPTAGMERKLIGGGNIVNRQGATLPYSPQPNPGKGNIGSTNNNNKVNKYPHCA